VGECEEHLRPLRGLKGDETERVVSAWATGQARWPPKTTYARDAGLKSTGHALKTERGRGARPGREVSWQGHSPLSPLATRFALVV